MNIFKLHMLLLLMITGLSSALAQQSTEITGKVADSNNEPLTGVSVSIKGKTIGTITDIDGNFKINAGTKETLIFSYMGMVTKEIKPEGNTIINVVMEYSSIELDEVVAIGYGTVKKRDLTSAVSSIQAKDLVNIPTASASEAIAGKIAGVQVVQSQGSPDAEISIRVRGGISITQSNEPLYVIDGFPIPDGLRSIDPSDIKSIEVLKDASATAIYGSQGANGVILITLKEGVEGKATVNFDMYVGWKDISKRMDLLSTNEFVLLEYERAMLGGETDKTNFFRHYITSSWDKSLSNAENMLNAWQEIPSAYGDRKGIDWQDEVFNAETAMTQNYKVSLNGGTSSTKYNLSYSRTDNDGIMKGSGYQRNNIRLRVNQDVTKKLRFVANLNYTDEETSGLGSLQESGYFSRMRHIIQYRPTIGAFGSGNDQDLLTMQNDPILEEESGNQMQNPFMSIAGEDRIRANKHLVMNGEVSYRILNGLTYKGSVGLRNRFNRNDVFYTSESRQAINSGSPYGSINRVDYVGWTYNNTLTYAPKIGKHQSLTVMLGQEDWWQESKSLEVSSSGFPDENFGLDDISLGETPGIPFTNRYEERNFSVFGRVNYSLHDKYLLAGSIRREGSSKFGANNKWGMFPAISGAWRISGEDFMKNMHSISHLKLRLGYGVSGNKSIPNYLSMSKMDSGWSAINNNIQSSYYSSQLPNPDLKWEKDITFNLGLDLGLFDQRIQLTSDFYINKAKDLLLNKDIPLLSGYKTTMLNIGETKNRGLEISLTSYNIKKQNFDWSTNFNISFNKNKVDALSDVTYFTKRAGWVSTTEFNDDDYIVRIGEPLGQMYGFVCDGIYTVSDFDYDQATGKYTPKEGLIYDKGKIPQPGDWKFRDTNDDKEITSDDKQVIGNANPDFFGGITNTFTFCRQFDFSFGITFQYGNDIYNANKMYYTKMNLRYKNSLAEAADRFTYIDETGANVWNNPEKLAAINDGKTLTSVNGSSNLVFHSYYVEDGSYIRLNQVTFGYTLPRKWAKKAYLQNARIYATAHNLLTITNYSGYDPEVNTKSNGGLTPGVDWGAYPRATTFIFGCNLTF